MLQRRKYSHAFKQEAVQLANEPGVTISQVAHELGLKDSVLMRWCKEQPDFGNKAFHSQGTPRDEEVAALKRTLARVKKDRDFLKEAAAFFAKESKPSI